MVLILIVEVTSLNIMLGPTCNIQKIANGHLILDEAANKLIQNFICCYSIDKPLTEKTAVDKKHCRKEEVPRWRSLGIIKHFYTNSNETG